MDHFCVGQVLIDHKVQSVSLHKQLDSLARDRDQVNVRLEDILGRRSPLRSHAIVSTTKKRRFCSQARIRWMVGKRLFRLQVLV